ncbi:uncharacterized protein KGF55_003163 [Candida pseudojiufengensis]|uniref:uncharacterized protein n=1 Tax=Candida pseudojiufengensis TaxID=497109 RepID=UPI00222507DB|nr:uncharacterized protein KGF55_003163 [Candida pseudojiufengensis]KAI5962087.1 hypothetical protein KGF55_003163 [Candida pseudojiufengensis]
MKDVLILHIGAGCHSVSKNKRYAKLIKDALGQKTLLETIDILEKSPLTNTGYGSNLNILGMIEIDSSFIKSNGRMGSITGLSIDCPTKEMFRIFNEIDEIYSSDKFGNDLLKPVTLNATSLKSLMNINDSSNLDYGPNREIYNSYKNSHEFIKSNIPTQDTIGVISIKDNDTIITASSGGNFLKLPGRIGCAGIIGASISFKKFVNDSLEISCMCSGNGEQIIQHSLAVQLISAIQQMNESDYGVRLNQFILNLDSEFYCGFIILINNLDSNRIQLLYGHTTESFHFGYKVNDDTRAILSFNESPGKFTFGEYNF